MHDASNNHVIKCITEMYSLFSCHKTFYSWEFIEYNLSLYM